MMCTGVAPVTRAQPRQWHSALKSCGPLAWNLTAPQPQLPAVSRSLIGAVASAQVSRACAAWCRTRQGGAWADRKL
eukprot:scaffold11619_cov99-Isochrysis_galbana.AAC.3